MSNSPAPCCRIIVMASGNGSNFQALIDAIASGVIPKSKITRLIVNRSRAYARRRAELAGIPWEYFNLISNGFLTQGEKDEAKIADGRRRYDAAIAQRVVTELGDDKPDLIVLAGWMHVFSAAFLNPLANAGIKIINLHLALPGRYEGAGAIERQFKDFQAGRISRVGIMVHYVVETVDSGVPILVREIPWDGTELADLKQTLRSHEHELIVTATAKIAQEIVQ